MAAAIRRTDSAGWTACQRVLRSMSKGFARTESTPMGLLPCLWTSFWDRRELRKQCQIASPLIAFLVAITDFGKKPQESEALIRG